MQDVDATALAARLKAQRAVFEFNPAAK